MHSTEDRRYWLEKGRSQEEHFCNAIAPNFGMWATINPEKDINPKVPDLLFRGELKSISTPLFRAKEKYQLDPQYTVTFNLKDLDYYSRCYPDLIIAFHVHWQQLEMRMGDRLYKVQPMEGVWRCTVPTLQKICKDAPVIEYQRRVGDSQNAKASYVFDVRRLQCLGVKLN